MQKIIVSYCRVSTKKQEDGYGLETQQKNNNEAIEKLMREDPALVRLDDIITAESAYKGDNVQVLMELVESGRYLEGSIIVVQDQSRFSRHKARKATRRMEDIVDEGWKIYLSKESTMVDDLDDDGTFITRFIASGGANKESEMRSIRTSGSYQTRLRDIKDGKDVLINSGHVPSWINKKYEESKIVGIELNEQRADVIRQIYEMYIGGLGANAIVGWLNENVEPWSNFDYRRKDKLKRHWGESAVSKILRNHSVIGYRTFNRTNEHEEVTVKDYYPAAISKELFYKAQEVRKNRAGSQVHRTKHPSIIYIGLAHCGYCGGKIVPQNFKNKRAAVRCSAHAKQQTTECAGGSSPARYLEKVLIELCRDQVNYNLLFSDSVDTASLTTKKSILEREKTDLELKLTNLANLLATGKLDIEIYEKMVGDDNDRIKALRADVLSLDREIESLTHTGTDDEVEFMELLKQVQIGDIPQSVRLRLKDLLRKFISRIDIYRYGDQWKTESQWESYKEFVQHDKELIDFIWEHRNPFEKSRANLGYAVTFKNGSRRWISYDYKSDTWKFTATEKGGHSNPEIS